MASEGDYHLSAAPDLSGKVNRHIGNYFFIFAILLFGTIVGLIIFYRFQVQYERDRKVGEVDTKESVEYITRSDAYLLGTKGLFEGKRNVPIEVAIEQFITDVRRGK